MISVTQYENEDFEKLLNFCKNESCENWDEKVSYNMWTEDWETNIHSLLFILKNTDRFTKHGKFFLLHSNDTIIGCGGVYISDFSTRVALAGVRTWLSKPFRNKQYIRDILLPEQKKWAVSQNVDVIALTFNEYNINLRKLFSRGQNIAERSPNHIFYKNYNELEYKVIVKGTPQWVIYENLTEQLFDWNSIRAEEDFGVI